MASQSVNLLLLIAALVLVARKPISKIFAERATKIKAQQKGKKCLMLQKLAKQKLMQNWLHLSPKAEIIAQAEADAQLLRDDFKQQIEAERSVRSSQDAH